MREILFRGMRMDNREWIIGDLSQENDTLTIYIRPQEFPSWDAEEYIQVYEKSVGQYTGMLDRGGNKIFEGQHLICLIGGVAVGATDEAEFKHGCFWLRRRNIPMCEFLENNDGEGEFEIISDLLIPNEKI